MRNYIAILLCLVLALPAQAKKAGKNKKETKTECSKSPVAIASAEDSLAYAYGMAMGKQTQDIIAQLKKDLDYDIPLDIALKAMNAQLAGDTASLLLTEEQVANIYQQTGRAINAKLAEKRAQEVEKNKEEGKAYFEKLADEPGIQKTESGLMYKIEVMGTGEKPAADSHVKVNYIGKLLDGTEFDNSYKRGKPQEMMLNRVIKGWQEGLMLMPVGSKFTLYIPSDIAYGDNGLGPIPGGSSLVFDVELIEIVKEAE